MWANATMRLPAGCKRPCNATENSRTLSRFWVWMSLVKRTSWWCIALGAWKRFLSQPFKVAEVFTGKEGKITPIADAIRSFEEICDGKWDHLPEQAFMYVGAVEEAEEQAKKMAAEAEG